jgi:FixJ family two-component response regulator
MTQRRLVMIDDDAEVCALVRDVAEPLGFAVETFTRAPAFLAAIAGRDPHTIVLDLVMPGVDGFELIRHLAAAAVRARILLMSGFDPAHVRMALTLGEARGLAMAGIVPKPVRVAALRALLRPPDGAPAPA